MIRNNSGTIMSLHQAISQQILVFHTAILDDCDRAARPDRTDAMALRLRANAIVLAKLQLEMLALTKTEPFGAERPLAEPNQPQDARASSDQDVGPAHEQAPADGASRPLEQPDHILSGDALSRFVSRRLDDNESPHDVWQQLNQVPETAAKGRRTPALPRKGFRSPAT
jgi:hypothetical protein